MRVIATLSLSALFLVGTAGAVATTAAPPPPQDARAWIATRNRHAQVLLDVLARFAPGRAGQRRSC